MIKMRAGEVLLEKNDVLNIMFFLGMVDIEKLNDHQKALYEKIIYSLGED